MNRSVLLLLVVLVAYTESAKWPFKRQEMPEVEEAEMPEVEEVEMPEVEEVETPEVEEVETPEVEEVEMPEVEEVEAEDMTQAMRCAIAGATPLMGLNRQTVNLAAMQSDANGDGFLLGPELQLFQRIMEALYECTAVNDKK